MMINKIIKKKNKNKNIINNKKNNNIEKILDIIKIF